jgi:hypothetical protein
MRRIAAALVLSLAAVTWLAAPGLAQAVQTASSVTAASVRADFDNDGFADLAVGVSSEERWRHRRCRGGQRALWVGWRALWVR